MDASPDRVAEGISRRAESFASDEGQKITYDIVGERGTDAAADLKE
jgi:hypothetical protein